MLVRDLMTPEVTTLDRDESLTIADRIMNLGRVRHLPVIDGEGGLVGMVSQRDLFRSALLRALGHDRNDAELVLEMLAVKEVMTRDVASISPDAPIEDAARRMAERKIGCLPVVAKGRVVGILTEGDFVAHFARGGEATVAAV